MRSLCLILAALCGGVALAGSFSDYEGMFPSFACQDGWAACIVDGKDMGVTPVTDSAGRPLPSNLRLGWFDLQGTAALSPFAELSKYPAEARPEPAPKQVASTEPIRPNGGGGGGERPVQGGGGGAQTIRETNGGGGQGGSSGGGGSTSGGGGSLPPTGSSLSSGGGGSLPPTGNGLVAGGGSTYTPPVTNTPPPTTTGGGQDGQVSVDPKSSPGVAPSQNNSCDDLVALEPAALMGRLLPGQTACLEGRLASTSSQTEKDKISRVLIGNAEAAGNKTEWERLMKRHLEDIDRSDPNLCFKYALHLSKGGAGKAWGTIKWADYALENKSQWSGSTYKTRVNSLYQLRAEAAVKLWEDANTKLLNASGTDRDKLAVDEEKLRGMAKDYSREWLDYARAAGEDIKKPMALCVSTSGSKKYCEEG